MFGIVQTAPGGRFYAREMLHEFLSQNRTDLIATCKAKVLQRLAPQSIDPALLHGIPQFLDQLIKTLRIEQTQDPMKSRDISGPGGGSIRSCPS